MGVGNGVTVVVDAQNRTGTAFGDAAKGAKTVGEAAAIADKQLNDMGQRLAQAQVKAHRLAEAEERTAAKARDLAEKMAALKNRINESGDESGKLGARLERMAIQTKAAGDASDYARRASNRAAEAAREQARSYDRVAANASQAARAVATFGAATLLSPGGGGGRNRGGAGSWLSGILGIGAAGAEGGLKGIGAGIGAIGSIGQAAGPYGMLAGVTAGAAIGLPLAIGAGAAAGGAVLGAGGAAGAGLGLAGAWANDPEKYAGAWGSATDKIKKRWLDSSAAFGNELDLVLKVTDQTLEALPVERVLGLSQSFVAPLAQGAGAGVTALADGFADLLSKAQPVIDVLGPALGNIGHAGGDALRMIGLGAEGGATALKDLADATGYVIRATGLMVLGFEMAYKNIRDFEAANFEFLGKVPGLRRLLGDFKDAWDISETTISSGRALKDMSDASTNAGSNLAEVATNAARAAVETLGLNDALTATRDTMLGMFDATFAVNKGWLDLEKGLRDGKRTLDQTTEAGLDNARVIRDQVVALEEQRKQAIETGGNTVEAVTAANAAYDEGIQRIRKTAAELGFTKEQTDALIASMGAMPPATNTKINTPGMPAALASSASLGQQLNQIDRTYIAHIQVTGLAAALAAAAAAKAALATIGGGKGNSGNPGLASGGVSHAASGGGQSGLTMVGEEGPEYRRLPTGTMIYPASNTAQAQTMAGWGGGGGTLSIGSDGSRLGDALVELIALAMKGKGGRPEYLGLKLQGRG